MVLTGDSSIWLWPSFISKSFIGKDTGQPDSKHIETHQLLLSPTWLGTKRFMQPERNVNPGKLKICLLEPKFCEGGTISKNATILIKMRERWGDPLNRFLFFDFNLFLTCQVEVVRFYVGCPASASSFSTSSSSSDGILMEIYVVAIPAIDVYIAVMYIHVCRCSSCPVVQTVELKITPSCLLAEHVQQWYPRHLPIKENNHGSGARWSRRHCNLVRAQRKGLRSFVADSWWLRWQNRMWYPWFKRRQPLHELLVTLWWLYTTNKLIDLAKWQDFNVSFKAWLFYGNKHFETEPSSSWGDPCWDPNFQRGWWAARSER